MKRISPFLNPDKHSYPSNKYTHQSLGNDNDDNTPQLTQFFSQFTPSAQYFKQCFRPITRNKLHLTFKPRYYFIAICMFVPLELQANSQVFTVTATGNARDTFLVPMQNQVIEADTPAAQVATNAVDLLRQLAGLEISGSSRANGQTFAMRGYGKQGVLVQVDGIRQGINTGHTDGIFLDSRLIKRVEVVRGPSALLYGSGALGGVVAFQTVDASNLLRDDQNLGFLHSIQTATGDNSIGSNLAVYGKTEQFDGLASLSYREKGKLKQSGLDSPNDEQILNLLTKASFKIDDVQTLSGQIRYYQNHAEQPRNPQQNAQRAGANADVAQLKLTLVDRKTRQRDIQANYQINPNDLNWLNLTLTGYERKVEIDDKRLAPNQHLPFESREQTTKGVKAQNHANWLQGNLTAHDIIIGTEYYRESQHPNEAAEPLFPEAKIDFNSAWLQDEMTLVDLPITFIAGTRFDHYRTHAQKHNNASANNWSSRTAVMFTPTPWLMFFGGYAQAFRAPTLGELYLDSIHFSFGPNYTNFFVPNPDLRPESNGTQEYGIGLRFNNVLLDDDQFSLKTSYFDTRARDYISRKVDMNFSTPPAPFPPSMPWGVGYTTSFNIPRAKITGWESELSYRNRYFESQIGYSRLRGKNSGSGQWIDDLSPDTLTANFGMSIAQTGLDFSWSGKFAEATKRINSGTNSQSGYGIHHFYLHYENNDLIPNIGLSLGLENAFDKHFYSPLGVPGQRRNMKLYASYRF